MEDQDYQDLGSLTEDAVPAEEGTPDVVGDQPVLNDPTAGEVDPSVPGTELEPPSEEDGTAEPVEVDAETEEPVVAAEATPAE